MDTNKPSPFDRDPALTPAWYREQWEKLPGIEVRLVEKIGECPHNPGDVFYYENPYKPPLNLCHALQQVLNLYTWRVALGFPSWNEENRRVYRIHCPDATGTIWEMRSISSEP
jgi:uncharacterized repeat protein (TIGR04076 family)